MDVIDSLGTFHILRKTLGLVDRRLVDHGERVAYILYAMLRQAPAYTPEQIARACTVGVLHDIGAYKTDEIDNLLRFETGDVWNHAVYGYLFIRNLSPLAELADAVLYHHLRYDKMAAVKTPHADLAACLHLADRFDALTRECPDTGAALARLEQGRGTQFRPEDIERLARALEGGRVEAKLESGAYIEDLSRLVEAHPYTDEEIRLFLRMLVYAIDFRSAFTVTHTIVTVALSVEIAGWMGLSDRETEEIYYGAMLHDVGKIAIPLSILEAPGKLTAAEMAVMRTHVVLTEEILRDFVDPRIVRMAVRHHEKMDGSGYPRGLQGDVLTMSERIVAVADILSALVGRRSYKEAYNRETVIAVLSTMNRDGKICPLVTDRVIAHYDAIMANANRMCAGALNTYGNIKSEFDELYTYLHT